jgi:hypothetical protein
MNPFHSIPFHDLTDGLLKQKEEHSTKKKKRKKPAARAKATIIKMTSPCPSVHQSSSTIHPSSCLSLPHTPAENQRRQTD